VSQNENQKEQKKFEPFRSRPRLMGKGREYENIHENSFGGSGHSYVVYRFCWFDEVLYLCCGWMLCTSGGKNLPMV
jgi:hypothetical protein